MADSNRITITPSQLGVLLVAAFSAKPARRVLIAGSPGLGKTSLVRAAAKAAGADEVIVFKGGVHQPEDVTGLPFKAADGKSADFLPFGFLKRIDEAAKGGKRKVVVFLDDMGQSASGMQAALMKFVDEFKDYENIIFVAATNKRTDRSGVQSLFEAVKSRFHTVVELSANLRDWVNWAGSSGIDSRVISFLSFRPDLLHQFDPKTIGDMDNFPCPRTWEHVSEALALELPKTVRTATLAGAIGAGAAVELEGFLRVAESLPDVDAVLIKPDAAPIPEELSAKWALAGALADRASKENLGRLLRYCERLHEKKSGEFAALTLNLVLSRKPDLISAANPHWAKAMAGPLGDLLIGKAAA